MRTRLARHASTAEILPFPHIHGKPFYAALGRILNGASPIRLNHQAILDLRRGVVAGYEVTPRFPSVLGPSLGACFEAARLLGKEFQIEKMVIRQSLAGRASLPSNCFLSINVSLAFLISAQFEEILVSISDLSGVVIEIAADESITEYDSLRHIVSRIRALDGFVALDQVGTGYSTLRHILEIKPNFIKLDRELVENCHLDQTKSVLIEMIGQAANRLDAWLIAEGVDTRQELEELIRLRLPLGQGRFLGRPHLSMQPISDERAAEIQSQVRKKMSPNRLSSYVEVCPVQPTLEAAQLVLANSVARVVVITDHRGRPKQILERHALMGVRVLDGFMKTQTSSDPLEALLRALTRPLANRFDPIIVINNRGLMQGIVFIDNLIRRVVEAPPA